MQSIFILKKKFFFGESAKLKPLIVMEEMHKHDHQEERRAVNSSEQQRKSTATIVDISDRHQRQQRLKEQIYNSPKQQEAEALKQRLQSAKKAPPNLTNFYEKPRTDATQLRSFRAKKGLEIVGELKKIADDTSAGWYLVKNKDATVGYIESSYF